MEKHLPFASFALAKTLLDPLSKLGYTHTTAVQELVIPRALRGESLLVRFQTGSGKTHAFLVPLFAKVSPQGKLQAIVVSPTRELAQQTFQFAQRINDLIEKPLKISLLVGGIDPTRDLEKFQTMPDLIFVTPGRLVDLASRLSFSYFSSLQSLVLDEADMLLDATFIETTHTILKQLKQPQLLVFSASMATPLLNRLADYLRPDAVIQPKDGDINPGQVRHQLIDIKHHDPLEAIRQYIDWRKPYFLVIFASTVQRVKSLGEALRVQGVQLAILHGDLASRERRHLISRIQQGEFAVVIASDIASRGIDLPNVSDVLSVDLPKDLDYYFHRAGRAGRYDQSGISSVFYNSHEEDSLRRIQDRGVHFHRYQLKQNQFVAVKTIERQSRFRQEDEVLKRDIKRAIQKYRSTEVKPGYKKKVKIAVAKVKQRYKRKAIHKKIRERLFGG